MTLKRTIACALANLFFLCHMPAAADTVYAASMAEVQPLIDAAVGPRTVMLPSGNQVCIDSIRLKSNITLAGRNTTLVFPAVKLTDAIVASGSYVKQGFVSSVSPDRRTVSLSQGSVLPGQWVVLDDPNATDSTLPDVVSTSLQGFTTSASLPERVSAGMAVLQVQPVRNITVRDLRIMGSKNPINFDFAENVNISNVTVTDCDNYMVVRRTVGATIARCVWERTGGGPFFLGCRDVAARDNIVTKHTRAGVFVRSCTNATVESNTMQGIPGAVAFGGNGDGLTVAFSDQVLVRRNDIRHTSCYGMWILNSQDTVVDLNSTTNCYTTSYFVLDCKSVTLSGNSSSTNAIGFGFTVMGSSSVNLINNIAYLVPRGFHCTGNAGLTLSGNRSVTTQQPDYFADNQP